MDVLEAARLAWDQTWFYRHLYGTTPESLADVPFITPATYHRARGVHDCIVDRDDVCGYIPSYHRNQRRFPFNIVVDEVAESQAQDRLAGALTALAINGPARFLAVTDDTRGPFTCDLVKGLAWERHQASMVYDQDVPGAADERRRQLEALQPDYLIVVDQRRLPLWQALTDTPVIVIAHAHHNTACPPEHTAWLFTDELKLIATSAAGVAAFTPAAEHLIFETAPDTGQTHVTTTAFACLPLIRYHLGMTL
jgi:hypothetical protein